MATFISHSPEETAAFGEKLGRTAQSGFVFALSGDLGAGKTEFVKGLARGLEITARIHSPTFTLVNEYRGGRLNCFHLDLYRLETSEEILSAGIDEFLSPEGVTVIEWADRLTGRRLMGPGNHWIRITIEIINATDRRFLYDDPGA